MRGILVSPSETQRRQFEAALISYDNLVLSKTLDAYPSPEVICRLIRAWAPEIIFLSMEDASAVEVVSRHLTREFPRLIQIALHSSQELPVFRHVLRLGMRELLVSPFDAAELARSLDQVAQYLETHPVEIGLTKHFLAFVPAKAGVGASTLAANATWAFSKSPGKSVLLADFDFHSGVAGFLFNADHEYCVADATTRSRELDDDSWQRLIKKVKNVDLLLSGAPRMGDAISSHAISHLVDFTRRNYSVVTADLPDTFDETSLAVMREANQIFLVTTPELPALRLAKLKAMLFRKLDLEDKVKLLVNRASKHNDLSVGEIEQTVGLPVFMSFPSDYAGVAAATQQARPAAKLAPQCQQFAEKILGQPGGKERRYRFIERFALVPLRYGFR